MAARRKASSRRSSGLRARPSVACRAPSRRSASSRASALLERVHRIYVRSGLAGLAAAFTLRDSTRSPERTPCFVEMARRIRASLSKWAPFTPESVDAQSWDDGALLAGDDRRIFRVVTEWLYAQFHDLPIDYVYTNTPPFPA